MTVRGEYELKISTAGYWMESKREVPVSTNIPAAFVLLGLLCQAMAFTAIKLSLAACQSGIFIFNF